MTKASPMPLHYDFKDLRFVPVLKPVNHNNTPAVTVRGNKTAKGKCTAQFSLLTSVLEGVSFASCVMAFNDEHYIFRFTPEANGAFEFTPQLTGKAPLAGNQRLKVTVPWPEALEFDVTKVGCGYELREGEFYIKYPKNNPKNQDVAMRPNYITPVKR